MNHLIWNLMIKKSCSCHVCVVDWGGGEHKDVVRCHQDVLMSHPERFCKGWPAVWLILNISSLTGAISISDLKRNKLPNGIKSVVWLDWGSHSSLILVWIVNAGLNNGGCKKKKKKIQEAGMFQGHGSAASDILLCVYWGLFWGGC